jgi:hypothetical protein
MKKSLVVLAFASGALALTLTGCGGPATESNASDASNNPSNTAGSAAPSAPPGDESVSENS